jgi:hypothetical protein
MFCGVPISTVIAQSPENSRVACAQHLGDANEKRRRRFYVEFAQHLL